MAASPWTLVGWVLFALLCLVGLGVFAWMLMVGVKPGVNAFKLYWRDRYRRRWRKGTWVPHCDICGTLAHYMEISPHIAWGAGTKRCWRHRNAHPPMREDGPRRIQPVNRETAWVTDKPGSVDAR